jgi:hypothetical protein
MRFQSARVAAESVIRYNISFQRAERTKVERVVLNALVKQMRLRRLTFARLRRVPLPSSCGQADPPLARIEPDCARSLYSNH